MGTTQEDLLERIQRRQTLARIQERQAARAQPEPEPAPAAPVQTSAQEEEDDPGVLERIGRGVAGVGRVPGVIFDALTAEDEERTEAQPFRPQDELSIAERALLDVGEGILEAPSAIGRGLSEVGHRTAIGFSELVGADRTAANLRADRELAREFYGEPETITGRVVEGGTQLVGEGALFMAPGAGAARGAQAVQATGRSGRFLNFLANPQGFLQRGAQTFLTGAPIDAAIAAAGPEESLAGAIGALTGDEQLEELARDPIARGAFEVTTGFGLGTALGETLEAVTRARGRSRARAEAEAPDVEAPDAPVERPEPEVEAPEPPAAEPRAQDEEVFDTPEDRDLANRLPEEVLEETTPTFERRGGARRRAADLIDPEGRATREGLEAQVVEQARATRRAFIDEKTGLANQNAWEKARARLEADPELELVSIDVRNQKVMNDASGSFALADEFLREVGDALRTLEGDIDLRNVFRSGGDEFAFAAPKGTGEELARRIQEAVPEREILDTGISTGLRFGVGDTVEAAEQAVQAAKKLEEGPRGRDVQAQIEEAQRARAEAEGEGVSRETPDQEAAPAPFQEPETLPRAADEPQEGELRSSFDVGEDIPNTASIGASLTNFEEVGVRHVPLDLLSRDGPEEMFAAADDVARARELAGEIQANNRLDPLIVVQDADGYYVLEGVHRLAAANALGEDAVPALIVRDLDELEPAGGATRQPPAELEERVRRRQEVAAEGGDAGVPWNQRAPEPAAVGERQQTLFPGDGRKIETEYAVLEAGDVRASHTADFTQRTPDEFPPEIQGRAYHGSRGRAARESTEAQVSSFDPDRAFDRTVTAAEGPPTVTAQGINVAGNGRTITLQRLYQMDPERARRQIRGQLIERAEQFGLDPEAIARMENPILVRRIVDDSIDTLDTQVLRELNQSSDVPSGKAKDAISDAFSRSEQLRAADGALRHFADTVGDDQTIRSYLETADGGTFLRRLVEDGVISQAERARFLDVTTGTATAEGKELVERMMYSAAIGDPDVLARAPSSVLRKMDTALPAIIRADRVPDFEIGPTIREALDLLASARAQNMKLDDLAAQIDITRPQPEPNALRMARFLEDAPKNSRGDREGIKDAFRAYADEAESFARQTQSDDLFGETPRGAEAARTERFGELAALVPPEPRRLEPEEFGEVFAARRERLEGELEELEARVEADEIDADDAVFERRELESELAAIEGDFDRGARIYFGTTDNPETAGYVLQDGDLLDFSGGGDGTIRGEDHRSISIIYPPDYEPPGFSPGSAGAYMADFIERGNVRLSVSSGGQTVFIDVPSTGVSTEQLRRLYEIAKDAEDVFVVHSQRMWADEGEAMLQRPSLNELNEAILGVLPPRRQATEAFDNLVGRPDTPETRPLVPMQSDTGPASTSHPLSHDLFGEPIEGPVRQGDLLEGRQGLQGIQDALSDARATVSTLEGLAARGAASPDELRRLNEARSFIRRQEGRGLDRGEVAARAPGGAAPDDNLELFPLAPTESAGSRLPQAGRFENDPNLVSAEVVPAPQIIREFSDALSRAMADLGLGLGLKTATGKLPRGGRFARALGVFNSRSQVIRQLNISDVPVFGHEAGHAMHKVFVGSTPQGALRDEDLLKIGPGAIQGELNSLGAGISGGGKAEGWAEFWRRYLDNREVLETDAPNLLAYVEERFEEFPAIKEAWDRATEDWTAFRRSSARARVRSQISVGDRDPFVLDIPNRWARARTAIIDDMEPVRRVVQKIRDAVGIDELAEEADQLARLARGSVGVANHFLEHGVLDFKTLRSRGPALREVLEPVLEDLDDFREYMVMRRAEELQGRDILTGFRADDVQATLRELEDAHGDTFRDAFDGIQKWNQGLLAYLRDSGVISKDSFDAILELNKNYVPFYRVIDEGATGGASANFSHLFSPVKRIRGSGREVIDPIESLVKNAMTYTQIAQKQQVSQALARLASKEGVGPVLEKLGNPIRRQQFRLGEVEQQLEDVLPGADELLEDLRARAEEDFAQATEGLDPDEIDALGIQKWDPAEELLAVFRPGDYFGAPNTISVLENGKRVWYEVDEELFQALAGLDREQLDGWARIMGIPARTLRAGATLAPEFLIRNPARDQVAAFVQSEYGFIPGVDMARGAFELLRKGEAYQQWIASGGYRAALTSLDRKSMQNSMRQLVENGGVRNVIKHPMDAIQAMSALMEDATRMGEFLNTRAQLTEFGEARGLRGRAELALKGRQSAGGAVASKEVLQRASGAAREISVDFARHGAKTAALRHLSAFWNARLQGYDRLFRAAKRDPVGFASKATAMITIPSLLEYAANRDDPDYWEQPQWKRDLFWLIKVGDDFVSIPKPFELGLIFGTLPVRIIDSALSGPGGGDELHDFMFDSLLKGESSGFIPQPTGIMPLIENTVNYSFFLRRPIVPRSEQEVRARFQAGPHTSGFAQATGGAVSDVARQLGQWAPGQDGISPRKIDNLLFAYTGGLGRLATEVTDPLFEGRLPFTTPEGEAPPVGTRVSELPGIRGVMDPPAGFGSESVETFYEEYSRAQVAASTLRYLERTDNQEGLELETSDEEANRLRDELPALRRVAGRLAELRAEVGEIRADTQMSPEEKLQAIEALGQEARQEAAAAIERELPEG